MAKVLFTGSREIRQVHPVYRAIKEWGGTVDRVIVVEGGPGIRQQGLVYAALQGKPVANFGMHKLLAVKAADVVIDIIKEGSKPSVEVMYAKKLGKEVFTLRLAADEIPPSPMKLQRGK